MTLFTLLQTKSNQFGNASKMLLAHCNSLPVSGLKVTARMARSRVAVVQNYVYQRRLLVTTVKWYNRHKPNNHITIPSQIKSQTRFLSDPPPPNETVFQKAIRRGSETISNFASQTVERTSSKASEGVSAAKNAASSALKRGSDSVQLAVKGAAESAIQVTKGVVSRGASAASDAIRQTTATTVNRASESITRSTSAVSDVAVSAVKGAKDTISSRVTVTSRKLTRSLWWWSLAAIAVYGISTTLPVELLKRATGRDSEKDDETEKGSRNVGREEGKKEESWITIMSNCYAGR